MAKTKRNKKKDEMEIPDFVASAVKFEIPFEVKKDIVAVMLFTLGFLSLLSFTGYAGEPGKKIFGIIMYLFGWGFWIIPVLFFAVSIFLIKGTLERDETGSIKAIQSFSKAMAIGAVFFVLSFLGILNSLWTPSEMIQNASLGRGGGYLGLLLALPLVNFLKEPAAMIVLFAMLVISLLLTFNLTVLNLLKTMKARFEFFLPFSGVGKSHNAAVQNKERLAGAGENGSNKTAETGVAEAGGFIPKITLKQVIKNALPDFKLKSISSVQNGAPKEANGIAAENAPLSSPEKKVFPRRSVKWNIPFNLLDTEDSLPNGGDIERNAEIIKNTLANFGITVEMGNVNIGPTVTQYTFRPSMGIKLSKITNLANDLALSLAAHPLRIEAPIPGKSLVGIEVPNRTVARVRFRGMIENLKARKKKSGLSIVLGQDVTGNVIVDDLGKMPHLLVAGATGSGKTIGINAIILALLFQNSPETLKFIMVDPKRVELSLYNGIPHLIAPVITEPQKAVNSLRWAISEMEKRYDILSKARVRDIYSYNGNGFGHDKPLPFIVIVIDELADLMMRFGREMEAAIVRLAQMSRAVGIHLIISTQRPSVEVITGLIKANITARIAFQVASLIDSRTILDTGGAEKLLGRGDMLYIAQDSHKPKRIQGAYLSEEEIKRVVDYIKQAWESEEAPVDASMAEEAPDDFRGGLNPAEFISHVGLSEDLGDALYPEAKKLVIEAKKASASLLQRRLRVGYARAARLLDLLEEQGVIGPGEGAKARIIYGETANAANSEENKTIDPISISGTN